MFIGKQAQLQSGLALISICLSLAVIIAWIFDIHSLLFMIEEEATMKIYTAIGFLMIGVSVGISNWRNSLNWLKTALSLMLIALSIATLLQDLLSLDFQIDQLLIKDPYSLEKPGRMSPATSSCFAIMGIGLYLKQQGRRWIKIANVLFTAVFCISFLALLAYLLDISLEKRTPFLETMALHTSLLFIANSFGLLLLSDIGQAFARLLSSSIGGRFLKQLLPLAFAAPMLMSFGLLFLLNKQLITPEIGIISYTLLLIAISIGYLVRLSISSNRHALSEKSKQELMRFKSALDEVSMVSITDPHGIITYVNEAFCQISGYRENELIGNTHKILNSGLHPTTFFQNMWDTIQSGRVWIGQVNNKSKEGCISCLQTAIIPIKNSKGEIKEYISIRQDITKQQKEIRSKESQYIEKLQQQNQELENLIHIASHDLREPINTILSFSSLIQEEKQHEKLNPVGIKSLHFIQEASERMNMLVKGLMDYSRISLENHGQHISVNDILDEIEQQQTYRLSEQGVGIDRTNIPKQIYGNKRLVAVLFRELIDNAIKFHRQGNNINIRVSAQEQESYWKFSIEDHGIGMESAYHKEIFALFRRLNEKSDYEGIGIGLAHCQKIIKLHEGEIWVEKSTPDKGSTISFTFPKESV